MTQTRFITIVFAALALAFPGGAYAQLPTLDPEFSDPEQAGSPLDALLPAPNPGEGPAPGAIRAFPSAQGFGAFARGGRGGQVVYVTTLADYATGQSPIMGSLRWAAEQLTGPRTILFKVGGNIALTRPLELVGESGSRVTIAGQSAPGDGIQLTRYGLVVANGAHDVIVRYLRIRVGYSGPETPGIKDSLTIVGTGAAPVRQVVVDHCSLEWAIDENADVWGAAENVSLQWCILGEGATFGHVNNSGNSAGLLLGGADGLPSDQFLTVHHCLFMNNRCRNPLFGQKGGLVEFTHNYVCNYDGVGTHIIPAYGTTPRVNIIGNVYAFGVPGVRPIIVQTFANWEVAHSSIYVQDNLSAFTPTLDFNNWEMVGNAYNSQTFADSKRRGNRWPTISVYRVALSSPLTLVDEMLADVGAGYPHWDPVDQRLLAEARYGTGDAGFGTLEDHETWPVLAGGRAYRDTDGDGMSDPWERSNGLDPRQAGDGPGDLDGDGYTNLEEFLNGIVGE